ncbi:hypothetical protein KC675_01490 [Candidatus Dojkabacteria bacterium]|uniref:Uncharacterized protein n=1 Tax=Candidatus Dojkabacteria bacterium TaxID=2099670 RepID=A0A955KZC6_9BACT|nr:hypothetical protein [Candidatus Dojkabacteria bacterium]
MIDNNSAPEKRQNPFRKDILRVLLLVFLSSLVLRETQNRAASVITNPIVNSFMIDSSLATAELFSSEENPNYRPMVDIVRQGISEFEAQGGKVSYEKSEDYRDIDYYEDALDESIDTDGLPLKPGVVKDSFMSKIPYEANLAYLQGEYIATGGFKDFFPPGSGFYNRLIKSHPDLLNSQSQISDFDKFFELTETAGYFEMSEMKEYIESVRVQNGEQPVSSSKVLGKFLEKNEGNLRESIYDTALFFKFMARNDKNTGRFRPTQSNVDWYKENILDEFQGPSYMDPEGDTLNLIGKVYHSWTLTSLVSYFPIEIVGAGGLYQQLGSLGEQGIDKTLSDLQTLAGIQDIDNLLETYKK